MDLFVNERNSTRSTSQGHSDPKSERWIAAALPHAYQVVLFLQRAKCNAQGRRALSIKRLMDAQNAVCRAIEYLRKVESETQIELFHGLLAESESELAGVFK
jgi:hypothetical protein